MSSTISRRQVLQGLAAASFCVPKELSAMTRQRPSTEYLVVHGSFTPTSMDIGVKEIDRWHRERGFLSCGYHAVIRRNGDLEAGRAEHLIGAGVYGFNETSWHVCMVGGKSDLGGWEANYTGNQFDALRVLIRSKLNQYPHATLLGHSDFPRTSKKCPGFNVSEWHG